MLDQQLQELRNKLKRSPVPSVSGSAPSEDGEAGSKDFYANLLSQVREEQARIVQKTGQNQASSGLMQQGSRRSSGEWSHLSNLGQEKSIQAQVVTQTDVSQPKPATPAPVLDGPLSCWSRADDEAQAEALRRIELLRQRSQKGAQKDTEEDATTMDRLNVERKLRQDAEKQFAQEKMKREATQQQVLCLEYELDGKESALQAAERQLEQRGAEFQEERMKGDAMQQQVLCLEYELDGKEAALQVAERQLEQRDVELQEVRQQLNGNGMANDTEELVRCLRLELADKERQLELKENEMKHMLSVLNQHGSTAAAYAPEDRMSSTYSAFPTMSFR